jgi:hypothetical protein
LREELTTPHSKHGVGREGECTPSVTVKRLISWLGFYSMNYNNNCNLIVVTARTLTTWRVRVLV